ncbi:type I-B CRISPR-associated protein Cas5b [Aneurinibacillus danicus]|uniref:Type I-B CRISPR-associated protein Cas5 n=1 Tax=Aneurinibacillus danicus TaxID=267746 RepID=A0A511V8R0_9BACL|nr:type I-B CRISPR-associated protein Cas5b [Aneurinibacillus danicus]GEN35327.1 type I-B CRISPR-associated protein Cas5 [Aneurinibacillus danicus]
MKTLVFELWGEWGHFRKYYSTSSPVTFSIIPPTAAFGVVAAILGLSKENNEYLKILNEAKTLIGIRPCSPVKKTTLGLNLINTKGKVWVPKSRKEGARTQIRTEFLRNAHFRLFVSMENKELYEQLVEQVKHHRTYYTLSLGLSENVANFAYVGEIEAVKRYSAGQAFPIHTAIPLCLVRPNGIPFTEGKYYGKERLPVEMNEERVVSSYKECLIEMKGQEIVADIEWYWEGGPYRFVFLNEQEVER